jgi:hypothetical protein
MNAIKMRWALYQTIAWLDDLEGEIGLNTFLNSLPNGFGGRTTLRELVSELPKPKHGYRVVLEENAWINMAFADLDCARQIVEYDEKGRAMVHAFSDDDISHELQVNPWVWDWDEMDKEEVAQWA